MFSLCILPRKIPIPKQNTGDLIDRYGTYSSLFNSSKRQVQSEGRYLTEQKLFQLLRNILGTRDISLLYSINKTVNHEENIGMRLWAGAVHWGLAR